MEILTGEADESEKEVCDNNGIRATCSLSLGPTFKSIGRFFALFAKLWERRENGVFSQSRASRFVTSVEPRARRVGHFRGQFGQRVASHC
jgi:hypothetical protein